MITPPASSFPAVEMSWGQRSERVDGFTSFPLAELGTGEDSTIHKITPPSQISSVWGGCLETFPSNTATKPLDQETLSCKNPQKEFLQGKIKSRVTPYEHVVLALTHRRTKQRKLGRGGRRTYNQATCRANPWRSRYWR